jgi:SAM-dependent methyltransferase
MYSRSAPYYDVMYGGKDYAAASAYVHANVQRLCPGARSLLDVACGTGRHLEHLQAHYAVEGLDLDPSLLAIARTRCPGVPLHVGDMVTMDLDRQFDAVTCLFSAIAYVGTAERLSESIARMTAHLAPGGVLVIEPWFTPSAFWPRHLVANFHDEPDVKLAWMYAHDHQGSRAILEKHFLVGTTDGFDAFTERHELGLFADEDYRAAFAAVELEAEHDPEGPFGRGLYLARRSGSTLPR